MRRIADEIDDWAESWAPADDAPEWWSEWPDVCVSIELNAKHAAALRWWLLSLRWSPVRALSDSDEVALLVIRAARTAVAALDEAMLGRWPGDPDPTGGR